MNKKSKKKRRNLKKFLKGFTLVELLAVIVILAIIMIIAIPAVIDTMNTASKKAMVEYAQKVMNRAEEKYIENMTLGLSQMNSENTNIIFDIRKDLGFTNTGNYYGTVTIISSPSKYTKNNYIKCVEIYSDDYVLFYDDSADGELRTELIQSSKDYIPFF